MTRWFRYYTEALNDPKIVTLSDRQFRTWVNLLSVASLTDGKLPSHRDLSVHLRMSMSDVENELAGLIDLGLIDILPDRSLTPHNWSGRQYASDSGAERMRKYREKNKNRNGDGESDVTRDVTVTYQKQIAEADTDTDLAAPLPPVVKKSGQQDFLNGFGRGKLGAAKRSEVRDHTLKRAEQLGLPVNEIVAEARAAEPDNLDAYVQAICRRRLKLQLPQASEDFLRAAFKRDGDAYQKLLSMLSMVL